MNTTRLTNAPKTREQLIAEHADHYDYDALQTPAYNGDGHGHGHDDDEWDPLDYDRADKKLAAYDEALERAYLANANDFTIEHLEDDEYDEENQDQDQDQDQEFEEESNDMLTFDEWQAKINETEPNDGLSFDEWQAKMTEDRQKRSVEFFKSYDEDMDYHLWLQEQIELHKDDPEFQYNLQLFTYNSCQNERLYATEDAAILDEEDDYDPLDYDRADKKLAAYDEALERAYLANEFTIEHLEDADYEQLERDRACQYFVEQAELHAKRNEYIIKRNQDILKRYNDDRTKRYNDFFKSYDGIMDYHVWLQEQIELHKGDPEFQYNLEIFTYTGPQIERLNAIDEAAGTESNNAFIRECKAADLEDAEWNKSVIYINKPFAPFAPFTPFTIGNDNNV